MRKIVWYALVIVLGLSATAAATVFVLNTDNTYPRSTVDEKGFQDLIVKEMFRRIGHQARVTHVPSERALANANDGIDDGDFVRIAGLEKRYPNLVMVPETVTQFQFTAFTKGSAVNPATWEDLKPYHVGIITGWKILEANIVGTRSLTKVRDSESLFYLLLNDRVDLVVFDRLQGQALIRERRLSGIRTCDPPLAQRDMYLYLHRRHEGLAAPLATALEQMKRDGTWQRLVNSVLAGERP